MQIGPYQRSQRAALVVLLAELAQYYGADGDDADVGVHLDVALTGPASPLQLITAVAYDESVVGLAVLLLQPSLVESSGAGRMQCQLKELFVSGSGRNQGAGEGLLRWCARFAIEQGCGRMDWNVRADNTAGIRFYERHGARRVIDRVSYRIGGAAMADLAADPGPASAPGPDAAG